MQRYRKGANAERELIKILYDAGYSVLRSAGSGVMPLPSPDIVALRGKRVIAFECKAWNSTYLSVESEKFLSTKKWCTNAGADFFIAWKIPKKGWLFLPPNLFTKTPKAFAISLRKAQRRHIALERVLETIRSLREES